MWQIQFPIQLLYFNQHLDWYNTVWIIEKNLLKWESQYFSICCKSFDISWQPFLSYNYQSFSASYKIFFSVGLCKFLVLCICRTVQILDVVYQDQKWNSLQHTFQMRYRFLECHFHKVAHQWALLNLDPHK